MAGNVSQSKLRMNNNVVPLGILELPCVSTRRQKGIESYDMFMNLYVFFFFILFNSSNIAYIYCICIYTLSLCHNTSINNGSIIKSMQIILKIFSENSCNFFYHFISSWDCSKTYRHIFTSTYTNTNVSTCINKVISIIQSTYV